MKPTSLLSFVFAFFTFASAYSQVIREGLTFTVASTNYQLGTGTHFHSNSEGVFGLPSGRAEVGRFAPEAVRGLSEFSLADFPSIPRTFVTFDVAIAGGLFGGANDNPFWLDRNNWPFTGTIALSAYRANLAENIADFSAPATAFATFHTSQLAVGSTLSFEITQLLGSMGDWPALGIRLQADPLNPENSGAWTFSNFLLTADDRTTAVPEPATVAVAGALALLCLALRRFSMRAAIARRTRN